MLITKEIQNHRFKRNKQHHTSFLLKQTCFLSKINDQGVQKPYSSSTQTPKKQKRQDNRIKSAHSKNFRQNNIQRSSLRPTTSSTRVRQKASKTVINQAHKSILNQQKSLLARTFNVNHFDFSSINQRMRNDQASKIRIDKKINQIVQIATKGKIMKLPAPKQPQNNQFHAEQNIFLNDKLRQLLVSQKISNKTYRFVKGLHTLQKRGRKQLKKKTQQQPTYLTIGNENALKVQNICRGGYVNTDNSQYMAIDAFNNSRQEFATLEQYYKRSKQQYKKLKNQKVNVNTNDMQPLQRQLKKGSMMSVVYLNQQAERMNEIRRNKFLQCNNFI